MDVRPSTACLPEAFRIQMEEHLGHGDDVRWPLMIMLSYKHRNFFGEPEDPDYRPRTARRRPVIVEMNDLGQAFQVHFSDDLAADEMYWSEKLYRSYTINGSCHLPNGLPWKKAFVAPATFSDKDAEAYAGLRESGMPIVQARKAAKLLRN